jgi:hypothetical protein
MRLEAKLQAVVRVDPSCNTIRDIIETLTAAGFVDITINTVRPNN